MISTINFPHQITTHDSLDSAGFNEDLAAIQTEIGVDDGGYASSWWSGKSEDWADGHKWEREEMVRKYVAAEANLSNW